MRFTIQAIAGAAGCDRVERLRVRRRASVTHAHKDHGRTGRAAATEQPTQPVAGYPTNTTQVPAQSAGTPAEAAATATGSRLPQTMRKKPLTLERVTIETTDATSEGVLADERSLNLPPGFHMKVYAAGLTGVRWLGRHPMV